MTGRRGSRGSWLILLSGMLLWTAHFFLLYGIGEFAGEGQGARIGVIGVTLACLAGCAAMIAYARRPGHAPADGFARWWAHLALLGLASAMIAIIWQALPVVVR